MWPKTETSRVAQGQEDQSLRSGPGDAVVKRDRERGREREREKGEGRRGGEGEEGQREC